MNIDQIRRDFDEIALLGERHDSGASRYDDFLVGLIPAAAERILDVGCGTGRLTRRIAAPGREVIGVDLSPEMVKRAAAVSSPHRLRYLCGDFLNLEFGDGEFDCIVSAAALHHMPVHATIQRIRSLVTSGGRVIIHDVRATAGAVDQLVALGILCKEAAHRFLKTGSPLSPRHVRRAWKHHGARETYLAWHEIQALYGEWLPGAAVHRHAGWRYTAVWDRHPAA